MKSELSLYQASLAVILSTEDPKQILLAKRNQPEKPQKHGKWHLPGGAIELDESPEMTLRRELQEELQLTEFSISREKVIKLTNSDFSDHSTKYHLFVVLLSTMTEFDISYDEDSSEVAWFVLRDLDSIPLFPTVLHALHALDIG